jgi:hypothetical protein
MQIETSATPLERLSLSAYPSPNARRASKRRSCALSRRTGAIADAHIAVQSDDEQAPDLTVG